MADKVFLSSRDYLSKADKTLGIDRRQRLASCLVLAAIDLPAPASDYAEHIAEASRICPGVTVNEIPMNRNSRTDCLLAAKAIIDELLEEDGAG